MHTVSRSPANQREAMSPLEKQRALARLNAAQIRVDWYKANPSAMPAKMKTGELQSAENDYWMRAHPEANPNKGAVGSEGGWLGQSIGLKISTPGALVNVDPTTHPLTPEELRAAALAAASLAVDPTGSQAAKIALAQVAKSRAEKTARERAQAAIEAAQNGPAELLTDHGPGQATSTGAPNYAVAQDGQATTQNNAISPVLIGAMAIGVIVWMKH